MKMLIKYKVVACDIVSRVMLVDVDVDDMSSDVRRFPGNGNLLRTRPRCGCATNHHQFSS